MPLALSDLYDYIFSNRANIKSKSDKNRQKVEDTIRKKFDAILSGNMREPFRALLRSLNSSKLEIILFGNNDDTILIPLPVIPTDDEIKTQFTKLDDQYKYFSGQADRKIMEEKFNRFFKACKIMADYVGKNNNRNDNFSYQQAYKIAVLFGGAAKNSRNYFSKFESYIKSNKKIKEAVNPVEFALSNNISVNQASVDLAKWRNFISSHGFKAAYLFQFAPVIKAKTGSDPVSMKDAMERLAKLKYLNYAKFPELADLCYEYKVDEIIFNECLIIRPQQKTMENLPKVIIDGSTVTDKSGKTLFGYYLVNLPIGDPRAYILGKMTACCQSIGGHGSQCTIDGITRKNNGFYVLLKRKNNTVSQEPLNIQGQINYGDYEIIGQGYAWLSRLGNLTFDSWENLRKDSDDAIIVPLLKRFGETITEDDDKILKVTVGTGGKTPMELRLQGYELCAKSDAPFEKNKIYINEENQSTLEYSIIDPNGEIATDIVSSNKLREYRIQPDKYYVDNLRPFFLNILKLTAESGYTPRELLSEYMREGKKYTDSAIQVPIFYSSKNKGILSRNINEFIDKLAKENFFNSNENQELFSIFILNPNLPCSGYLVDWLEALFFKDEKQVLRNSLQDKETLKVFIDQINSSVENLGAIYDIYQNGLLNLDILNYMKDYHMVTVSKIVISLHKSNLLSKTKWIDYITAADALKDLSDAGILNEETIKDIDINVTTARLELISTTFIRLASHNLLTKEIRGLISLNPFGAHTFASVFIKLQLAGLFNDVNLKFILHNKDNPGSLIVNLCNSLINLNEAGILTDDNRKFISEHKENDVTGALVQLHRAGLLTDENRQLIGKHEKDACILEKILEQLNKTLLLNDEIVLTNDNFKLIINNIKLAHDIANILYKLNDANILTNANFNLIITHLSKLQLLQNQVYSLIDNGIFNEKTLIFLINNRNYFNDLNG